MPKAELFLVGLTIPKPDAPDMAYDSETFGQSPFGNVSKPKNTAKTSAKDDGLDTGPAQPADKAKPDKTGLASKFPTIAATASKAAATATPPAAKEAPTTKTTKRKSRSGNKSGTKSPRKSKKAKAAEAAAAEAAALEAEIARRFLEEDQRAYLSLLQYTAISGLVWAVLRLSRYELSDEAIAMVNLIIHPLVISGLALCGITALTFWTRRLLNDLARHTQQLQADAETEDTKNFRPTIEIVGDALEYNPRLRKNIARLFNTAAILVCTLISYLLVIGLHLAWEVK